MEQEGKTIKKSYWLIILITQTILLLGIVLWAITQKVEADKQKVMSLHAQKEASLSIQKGQEAKTEVEKQKALADIAKAEALEQKALAEAAKTEALKYKELYEKSLKNKK